MIAAKEVGHVYQSRSPSTPPARRAQLEEIQKGIYTGAKRDYTTRTGEEL